MVDTGLESNTFGTVDFSFPNTNWEQTKFTVLFNQTFVLFTIYLFKSLFFIFIILENTETTGKL